MGWATSDGNDSVLALEALGLAVRSRHPDAGLISPELGLTCNDAMGARQTGHGNPGPRLKVTANLPFPFPVRPPLAILDGLTPSHPLDRG